VNHSWGVKREAGVLGEEGRLFHEGSKGNWGNTNFLIPWFSYLNRERKKKRRIRKERVRIITGLSRQEKKVAEVKWKRSGKRSKETQVFTAI